MLRLLSDEDFNGIVVAGLRLHYSEVDHTTFTHFTENRAGVQL